ncbi:MAG: hypothetical protein ACFCVD_18760 [Nodosilinea sp.]
MLAPTTGLTSAPAVAQTSPQAAAELEAPEAPQNSETDPAPPAPAAPAAELDSYDYDTLFSIGFPAGWQVAEQGTAPQVTATSPTAPAPLRTEVTWFEAPPREVVPQAIEDIQTNGYAVTRYDAVNIDGTTALRLWVTDLPDALPNAFMTYIGYENATAAVVTYYGENIPDVDNLLNSIHQSFQRHSSDTEAPPADTPSSAPTNETPTS